jgi:excisionase family DNA binding protein
MPDPLLLPREVAELFGVTPATVTRWANEGRLPSVQTPSGRHRFRMSEINRLRPAATGRPAE